MNKPGWITVVGIILIVLGCFGALGAWQTFYMPSALAKQKEMLPAMQERMEQQKNYSPEMKEKMEQMYTRMMSVPSWFDTWCLIIGIFAILFAGFFIFTAISLFQLKGFAIELFYWVLGIDIGYLILRATIAILFVGFLGMSMVVTGVLAGITDIVLLIVVANGKKEIFNQKTGGIGG